jgi:hypothetical protein
LKEPPASIDRMLSVWNEQDLSRLPGLLEAALTSDVVFIDPTIVTRGLIEFEQNVRHFRARYPQASVRRASGIDSHHGLHRYAWEIDHRGKVLLRGMDVAESSPDGRVNRVLGFFGPLTPAGP